ncbi:MAG: DUF3667 domain-containing protein [Bacteroidetes bacterium]|nr:DUF3667 domain-containing protein [Bacteroidota bacterium]
MDNPTTSHTCKNCGNNFSGKYCNICGEKVYTEHDRSVVHIIEEAFHFLTHFEGNFFTTIKTMFRKPGQVSLDYTNGIRKKYYKPVTLFFFLIVLYLVAPHVGNINIFPQGLDMEMKSYMAHGTNNYASRMVAEKLQQKNVSIEVLAEAFKHKSHTVSKVMLFILLPLSTLVLMVLYPRKKLFYDNFMLSTEINAIFLSAFFMVLPIILNMSIWAAVSIYKQVAGHPVPIDSFLFSEGPIIISSTILFLSFITVCFKRFYGSTTLISILKGIVFVLFHYIIVFYLYKFLLFTTVMWLL